MNSAMVPGSDIFKVATYCARCPRCDWNFIGEGKVCPDCENNPLFDRNEEQMLKGKQLFEFMGWKFAVRHQHLAHESDPATYLYCYKRLFNPEKPGEVYSQCNFSWSNAEIALYRGTPDRKKRDLTKRCAAWLIAHWWEHYLEICPCLKGERNDDEDSNFRKTVIESLLWYDSKL